MLCDVDSEDIVVDILNHWQHATQQPDLWTQTKYLSLVRSAVPADTETQLAKLVH